MGSDAGMLCYKLEGAANANLPLENSNPRLQPRLKTFSTLPVSFRLDPLEPSFWWAISEPRALDMAAGSSGCHFLNIHSIYTHIITHTHTNIYIYICVCVYIYIPIL